MQKCSVCKIEKKFSEFNKDKYKKSGYRSQCKSCMIIARENTKEYTKKWRSTPEKKAWYADYRKKRYQKEKNKMKARNATRKLEKMPCEVCGKTKVEAHHDDYSKPLDVRWLCRKHHNEWHKENGEALNP